MIVDNGMRYFINKTFIIQILIHFRENSSTPYIPFNEVIMQNLGQILVVPKIYLSR